MIKNRLTSLLLLLLLLAPYAVADELNFLQKLETLYNQNASIEDKTLLFNSEFYNSIYYHDLFMETSNIYINSQPILSSDTITDTQMLMQNIEEFYKSANNNGYINLLKQIETYFISHSQENMFIVTIGMLLYQFEDCLESMMKILEMTAEEHKDQLFLAHISKIATYETSLEDNLEQGLIADDIGKDLLFRKLLKKALKDHSSSLKSQKLL